MRCVFFLRGGWGCANICAFRSPRTREAIRRASVTNRRSASLDYSARGLREEAARSEAYNLVVQGFSGRGWGFGHICAFRSPRTREAIRRASVTNRRSVSLDYIARGLREEAARSEAYNLVVQGFSGRGWGFGHICAFRSPRTREAICRASVTNRRSAPLDCIGRGLREEAARSEAYNKVFRGEGGVVGTSARFAPHAP